MSVLLLRAQRANRDDTCSQECVNFVLKNNKCHHEYAINLCVRITNSPRERLSFDNYFRMPEIFVFGTRQRDREPCINRTRKQ